MSAGPVGDASRIGVRSLVGTLQWVAVLFLLDQDHRSVPLRTRSDSSSWPSWASRTRSGPSYQTRIVWEPDTREATLPASPPCPPIVGNAGSPRSEFSTTVPESALTLAPRTSTSNCAAVRGGSDPCASAVTESMSGPALITPAATTAGTAHRALRERGIETEVI